MSHPIYQYLNRWCQDHGWTDLFVERYQFWAFPPGSVMPLPLPAQAIESFYLQQRLSGKRQICLGLALVATALAGVLTTLSHSPMPLIAAFACAAIAVGLLDDA